MFDPGWKRWSVSVLSYLQLSSRYNRPAVLMSTCLSLVHGSIFLLYVYLFNKDVCWEICHGLFTLFVSKIFPKMSQPLPSVVDCIFYSFCLVFCLMFALIYQSSLHFLCSVVLVGHQRYVYTSISRFWKNLAMVWHMSAYYGLVSCLTL